MVLDQGKGLLRSFEKREFWEQTQLVRLEIVILGSQETGVSLGESQDEVTEMSGSYWGNESFGMKIASCSEFM